MTSAASDQIYCFKCRSKTDTLGPRRWSSKTDGPPSPASAPSAGPRSSAWARPGSDRREGEALWRCCSL